MRFRVGDRVIIVGTITTRYMGKQGIVLQVKPPRRIKAGNPTLSRYLIEFSAAHEAWFFTLNFHQSTRQNCAERCPLSMQSQVGASSELPRCDSRPFNEGHCPAEEDPIEGRV
jgi:hypothetical protein